MLRVGIFFGGQSREREISFAGGRTVYDNLDKALFKAFPIFVDSENRFIHLQWQYIYKGTIRDFYPQKVQSRDLYIESLQDESLKQKNISAIGREIQPSQFKDYFDFAFLTLHGIFGEDGTLQGLLEWYGIPYSGADIFSTALGIDKHLQKKLCSKMGFEMPLSYSLRFEEWQTSQTRPFFEDLKVKLGLPLVIKPTQQGSSLGVHILKQDNYEEFVKQTNRAFFCERLTRTTWLKKGREYLRELCDLKHGLGLPLLLEDVKIFTCEDLIAQVKTRFDDPNLESIFLRALRVEPRVLFEKFIAGREFSCIVIDNTDGEPVALPPTEILKKTTLYDYRSKYLAGVARKITPIDLPDEDIRSIQRACVELYRGLNFKVYARIDGILQADGKIYLNDPNTTSGMLPSSFFFHQAAEIGLNPSNFLTYIIHQSLQKYQYYPADQLSQKLIQNINSQKTKSKNKLRVALLLGGFSFERHISVESARNIYEKLASSDQYLPIPIFIKGTQKAHELYQIPINLLLKDNADDIAAQIDRTGHPIIADLRKTCHRLTDFYAQMPLSRPQKISYATLKNEMDFVFIAMHGRPGEDGQIQAILEAKNIPFNGSGSQTADLAMNKYLTNEFLNQHGILTAKHSLISKAEWTQQQDLCLTKIENKHGYPMIVKPVDDGCSAGVRKIQNPKDLKAFANLIFRESTELLTTEANQLNISPADEFPYKKLFLVEDCIQPDPETQLFLEITGGLLTHFEQGQIRYEIFKPSQALAQKSILSLEEKFLAGEGQNITPASYSSELLENEHIETQIRTCFENVTKILNLQGYARIDAFAKIKHDKTVEIFIIEVNTLPGMTPATCIFHQAALANYKPLEFISQIISFGMNRNRNFINKPQIETQEKYST